MLTEEEAKTKWCVHSPIEPTLENAFAKTCEASACMAWRKTGSKYKNHDGTYGDRDLTGRGQWIEIGYCGLAGRP